MEHIIQFAVDNFQKIKFDDYDSNEFAIARMGFLSTRPNSHHLEISEEVLRACAPTVLGKWVVAEMQNGDATTHTSRQNIMGYIPRDQEVEFVYDRDGYLRAYVDTVISKVYAKEYYEMFESINERAVSVEMQIKTTNDKPMEDIVEELNILGVTTLGLSVNPSCPESDITLIRFSEENAENYFNSIKEQKVDMAVTYKVDKSKESISDKPWGEVDKTELRNKIMDASNRGSLVKDVYMLVEDGWEDAPSEHLKYPVMELKGDIFVYNRDGLASALGYAKKENETAVVNKVIAIYKKLDIDLDGKGEDAKMSEIELAEVQEEVKTEEVEMAEPEQKEEEKPEVEETEMAEECKAEEVQAEMEETKEPEEEKPEEETEAKMSEEEMMSALEECKTALAEKDNIIMEKDALIKEKDIELESLREFQRTRLEADKACMIENVMSSIAQFVDKETADSYRQEGMECNFAEIDAWSNKVKASVVDKVTKFNAYKNANFTRMSGPNGLQKENLGLWDRVKQMVE